MTEGLVVLIAWIEWILLVAALLFFVYRSP